MKHSWMFLLPLWLLCFASAQEVKTPPVNVMPVYQPGAQGPQIAGPIFYGGGPIMSGATNVYVVFYGDWPAASINIINGYLQHLGGTLFYNVTSTYSDTTGAHVQNIVNYNPVTNSIHDNYSSGKTLVDADVQTIVANAIAGGLLPNDEANGVYFVLTAVDVAESLDLNGQNFAFCTSMCGYHAPSKTIVTDEIIKYSFVGNPAQCPHACDANIHAFLFNDTNTPNGDVGGDGAVNVIFHELSETVSDPHVTLPDGAWGDLVTGESGDQCAWMFGTTHLAPNGSHFNETINKTHYLIQQLLRGPRVNHGSQLYFNVSCVKSVK